MAKKQNQVDEVVENESVEIDEKDVTTGGELKENEVEVAEEKKETEEEEKVAEANDVKLKVLIAFTDKYTNQKYKVNDVISVEEERAKELLADPRRLVEKLK